VVSITALVEQRPPEREKMLGLLAMKQTTWDTAYFGGIEDKIGIQRIHR
jgi:hypothetical protein